MNYIVEIENLTKDYEVGFLKKKKVRALDSLNLQVERGQIFGFLGGNGAGKTTTIKLLMGLMFPTSGTAKILGSDISDTSMHSRIGYVPENPYFYDYLTARELMMYFAELFGIPAGERKTRTEALLTKVGLEEVAWNRQLRKFSKGMLQRTGLAQSLINDPEIVFMDEPMSGLDPMGRREIRELIAGLRNEGKTVFMSTHILSDIEVLCDNVAILRNGRLAATGRLDDLLTQSGEAQIFEVNISGLTAEQISAELAGISGAEIKPSVAGVNIYLNEEKDLDRVLPAVRKLGGRLISVQPVKQSLEELFVKETSS